MAGKTEQDETGSQEVFFQFLFHVKKENKSKKLKKTITYSKATETQTLGFPLWLSCLGCLFLFYSNCQEAKWRA